MASAANRVFGILMLFATVVSTLLTLFTFRWTIEYPLYLATRGDIIDAWAVLSVLNVALVVIGTAGAWWLLWRRRFGWVAASLALTLPAGFLIEANRCDYFPSCRSTDWARLPPAVFKPHLRIRPVDNHAAQVIAQQSLEKAKLPWRARDPKLVDGQWHVETRSDDMDLGPYEVIIDPRTEDARIVLR